MVTPGGGFAEGRHAREAELDRLRAGERDRLPHLHRVGARPIRRAVLQLPARANTEGPTRRTPQLAEGRIPGLMPIAASVGAAGLLAVGAARKRRRPDPSDGRYLHEDTT